MPITITVGAGSIFSNHSADQFYTWLPTQILNPPGMFPYEQAGTSVYNDAHQLIRRSMTVNDPDGLFGSSDTLQFFPTTFFEPVIGAFVSTADFHVSGSADRYYMSGTFFYGTPGNSGAITQWVTGQGVTSGSGSGGYPGELLKIALPGGGIDDTYTILPGATGWNSFTGMNFGTADFFERVYQYGIGNTAPLDTLLRNTAYVLNGGTGDDVMEGYNLADVLNGNGGNDTLWGGDGNDILRGGAGINYLSGNGGQDTFESQAGGTNDVDMGTGDDFYILGDGADTITDEGGLNDTLRFTNGLSASWDVGYYIGDLANDFWDPRLFERWELAKSVANQVEMRTDFTTAFTIVGGEKVDSIKTANGNDTLSGNGGGDFLFGMAGQDTLVGGLGSDHLDGGNGRDRAFFGDHFGNASGGWYIDLIAGTASTSFTTGTLLLRENDELFSIESITASDGNDTIRSNGGSSSTALRPHFDGRAGHDKLILKDTITDALGTDRATDDTVTFTGALGGSSSTTEWRQFGLSKVPLENALTFTNIEEIFTGLGNDVINGNAGTQIIHGGAGNDRISGGAGDDVLSGDEGHDVFDGGGDFDTISFAGVSVSVNLDLSRSSGQNTGALGVDTVTGGVEKVIGGDASDRLTGSVAIGGVGNDILFGKLTGETSPLRILLDGGEGDDILTITETTNTGAILLGGNGTNTLRGGNYFNIYVGGLNVDTYTAGINSVDEIRFDAATSGVTFNLSLNTSQNTGGAGIDRLVNPLSFEIVYGTRFNDFLTGNDANNVIFGGAILTPGGALESGDDVLSGGGGDDVLHGGDGFNQLIGGTGNDELYGGGGVNIFFGGLGNDKFYAVDGSNTIDFRLVESDVNFNTMLEGIAQNTGVAGTDTIYGSSSIVSLFGGKGNDVLTGKGYIVGDLGNDTLTGSGVKDELRGDAGNDKIDAGGDDDFLTGSLGADTLTGGTGADQFVYLLETDSTTTAAGRDMITDFNANSMDKIGMYVLTENLGAYNFIGNAAIFSGANQIRYQSIGGNTYVYVNTDSDLSAEMAIGLKGIVVLDSADFIF